MGCSRLSVPFAALIVLAGGCGNYPERLLTRRDVELASPGCKDIDIRYLPAQDYPLLAKFKQVYQISFFCPEGTFATDEKMKLLAGLAFTNLSQINLLNCRLVDDDGIRALVPIRSLRSLGLEGTSITDAACELIGSKMSLTGIDVANCPHLSLNGLKSLTNSHELQEISFSADAMTGEQLLELLGSFKHLKWCSIVDQEGRLSSTTIIQKAAELNIQLVLRKTGALQDMNGGR